MGFFSSITNSIGNVLSRAGSGPLAGLPIGFGKNIRPFLRRIGNVLSRAGSGPLAGLPIGFGKNILPLNIQASNTPASVQRPEGLLDDGRVLLPDIPSLSMGGGGTAFGGTGVTTPPAVGGFGAPEQLPGGGYRVYDNRTGKWIYGGGAVDPNAPQPSPAPAPAPGPAEPPATPDIGQIVGPRSFGGGGFLGNLMSILGGAFPQGPVTENAPPGFGRFLRRMAASRFSI